MSLRDDLSRSRAYPALRPSRVELVETHISWVFLLERDVFKVKKPVDFGFLDFRALEDRQAACEAEVALNSRLSPAVYFGVVPVRRGDDGRAQIEGEGSLIDFAVHMARLPEAQRADLMLSAGTLTDSMLEAIAKKLAQFHAAARCDPQTAQFGTSAVLALNVAENFTQTRETLEQYLDHQSGEQIIGWQTEFLKEHATTFQRRIAAGRVRDGHGDLRLEHIYVDEGEKPTIIDCIEFNDRFRFADVCADIAFLSMDLASHGRVDLAERLLALYARESNDFDLYTVVDFYESYRAFVRGKVASMVAGDTSLAERARQRAAADARRHFLLALSADRRSLLRPSLVALAGVIGSGKSTMAERLATDMGAPVISTDRTRKAMLGVAATHPVHDAAWEGAYAPALTERVYAEALSGASTVLATGRPVVIDASFSSASMRSAARAVAESHAVPFRLVECRAPLELCRSRLVERQRHAGVSDGRLAIFDELRAHFEPITELPSVEHIVLDTSKPEEENVAALREQIGVWPPGFVT